MKVRTMEEFATASGISRPTISRFFSDPTSVRPSSRQRIEAAMVEFGYRPNLMAVNFNRKKPKTLGLLVPSLTDPFYAGLAQRVEKMAAEAGYWTIIQNSHGDASGEVTALATLESLNVAGAILAPLGHASKTTAFKKLEGRVPVVFLDTQVDVEGPFVGTDNGQSMSLMVEYLVRSGGNPVYFDMPDINRNARDRRAAYVGAMERNGLEPRIIPVAETGWEFERIAFETASDLFSRSKRLDVDTILCANDRIAFGVMAAATEAGLSIGRDGNGIRIAGHDDHPLSRFSCPSLTTVAQDQEELAKSTLDILMALISGSSDRPSNYSLPATLVMRRSA
ncbi:LacI family DNA-binding transcriptional regulator [Aureimonas psammosilenae]|uniref:LacI family DNA-binding transcriptional regulator n=1 Tax=Aureimonas psammosilenae TaxID=2495496 RepID=UPI001AED28D9|nr:LacI family DNA-binding transcriptional regulator [Aureimonas psammosilenae]